MGEKEKSIEFAKDNDTVAKLYPADFAYWLMVKIRELDVKWWKRYWKRIARFVAWLVGVPIVGSIIDWLKENWDKLPFVSEGPTDVFQSEEYVFLSLNGAWIVFLLELASCNNLAQIKITRNLNGVTIAPRLHSARKFA